MIPIIRKGATVKSKLVIPIEFGDIDPAAIVFYPNFFRWFDASAWHLFIKAGLTLEVFRDEFGLMGVPIVEANSRFIKPARFRDTIEITSYVGTWNRKTFDVVHEAYKDGQICAEGVETRVCARINNDKHMRAIDIPEEIRQRLSVDD